MKETTIKAKCNASNKHTTGVYTSFFKQRSDLRWTQKKNEKGARQRLNAENNCSKGLTKSTGGTNDRSITILGKETIHQECIGDYKSTTNVYVLFFTPKCELH